jgi:hypothetical protein
MKRLAAAVAVGAAGEAYGRPGGGSADGLIALSQIGECRYCRQVGAAVVGGLLASLVSARGTTGSRDWN